MNAITKEQFDAAVKAKEDAQQTINLYFKQKAERFEQRMKMHPIFTDDELVYSARNLCPCGHGLAYPKDCGPGHYWDCSAILKGVADPDTEHTGKLPFSFYNIQGESQHNGSTRGVFQPKP